eukprot:NODE_885_length_2015_cov_66.815539_g838_i0.p2 GENE.NODE_885_length_2015_cov_66.815539_g838_i0~~NODE_885_length_2015_cov_66.815539_g838_i0.p2  ORF type:complete len:126 (+),score=20.91 NODE_885_length_2015_cov_66.815539_g838_i0:1555-1932(+)
MPDRLLNVLQVYALPEKEWAAFIAAGGFCNKEATATLEDNDDHLEQVYGLLVAVINSKLSTYPEPTQSIQDALRAIGDASRTDPVLASILTIRVQERRMLLELKAQVLHELQNANDSASGDDPSD